MAKKNNCKVVEKVTSFILNVLLTLMTIVIVIGLYYIYQIKIEQKDYANMFGYTFFEVATGSMYPTIKVGDVVIVELTNQVEQDEIIVYKEEKSIITHRLIGKNDDKLITRGDANNSEDKPISEDMVLGKVIKILPQVGIWRKIFTSPEVVGLIILLISILGVAIFYTSNSEEKDGE